METGFKMSKRGEKLGIFAAGVGAAGAVGMFVTALILLDGDTPPSRETRVSVQLDDLAQLGEGVVLIGDQACPLDGRLPGVDEGVVVERQSGDSGYIYAIDPVAVYQTTGPNIYCGPDSEGMGTTFDGNALIVAGPDTQFASQG